MPWFGLWSKQTNNEDQKGIADEIVTEAQTIARATQNKISSEVNKLDGSIAGDSISSAFSSPATLISTAILTTAILTLFTFQRRHLRRVSNVAALPHDFILPFKKRFTRSLFGRVTSVGDADNFRLFHTPLGRLAAWDWLRKTPSGKALKDKTVHIRLAGIDAPELSHFGRPAQPYSKEALDWLTKYVMGRRVRCYVHKADQYGRVVATVYVRKGLLRRDVGLQMLRAGYATMYEAKTGGEFGGPSTEERYKKMEQWAKTKRKGMWADKAKLESPREYKERYREGNKEK